MGEEKTIIIITCTYEKPKRTEYIKRLIKIFNKVKNIFWIIVEDGNDINKEIDLLLRNSGIKYVYKAAGLTRSYGNAQKNFALTYIKDNNLKGIVYFADDDSGFDIRMLDEIQKTKRVSIFPVGNLGPGGIERPIVRNNKIVGWDAGWITRKFCVDIGGFAFDSSILQSLKDPLWSYNKYGGETEFLEKFVKSPDEFELLCNNCTKCYVWHNEPLNERLAMYMRFKNKFIRSPITNLKIMLKNFFPKPLLNIIQRLKKTA